MAIYAIGDIQGCYDELRRLLDKINYNDDRDRLWFTGDLVNRGPKSLQTLRMIKSMDANAIVVLGNHDLHLLATAYDHQKPGKKDTLDDILAAPDRETLFDWLRFRPMIHVDEELDLVMVHAGLHPAWTVEKALSLAREVEAVLRSDDHIRFYEHMYGDKPRTWSDSLEGWSRLRFITNTLTRLRYCDDDGKVRLNVKGVPGTQPKGLKPWFELGSRKSKGSPIIFGHWSTLSLLEDCSFPDIYPLDTGCLWGGRLTAMRIDRKPYTRTTIDCPQSQKPKIEK